ncbi:hypothetical protein JCM5296_007018 [Sporobolomyces johnsonii]
MDPSSSSSFTAPSGPDSSSADDPSISPRVAAIAKLKRAASTRESPSASSSRSRSPSRSPSLSRSTSTSCSRPRPTAAPFIDDDTSLFLSPNLPGGSALERTASLLARQLAMAKLTGSAPPTPPPSFFTPDEPLPTLEELQHRARAKIAAGAALRRNNTVASGMLAGGPALAALRRNNTVTGAGVGGMAELLASAAAGQEEPSPATAAVADEEDQPLARAEARVNLMRKLSARRLEKPAPVAGGSDRLGVVGRIGRARPRSGSVGALDWRLGGSTPPPPPPPPAEPLPLPGRAPPTALPTQLGAPLSLAPLQIPSSTSSGHIGIGISFDNAHPEQSRSRSPAALTPADRSETPFSQRSSGGSWDRQSEDNNAWEFADALRSNPGDRGEEDRDDVEVIRNSQQQQQQQQQLTTPRAQQLDLERTPRGWEDGDGSFPTTTLADRPLARMVFGVEQQGDDTISPRTSPTSNQPPADWPSYSSSSRRRRSSVEQQLFPSSAAASRRPSSSTSSGNSTPPPAAPNPSVVLSSYTSDREARLRNPLVPSFGIAAVEEYAPDDDGGPDGLRKRGSSASSSLALLEGRRFRGSDAVLLREGSGASAASASGSEVRWDRMGSGVSSGSDAVEERADEGVGPAGRAEDARGRLGEGEGQEREEDLERRERALVDKVEKKREEALARGKEGAGAFPPPAEGYHFPPSPNASSPRESQDFAGEKDPKPQPSAQQLFDQLASTSNSPPQQQRKPRDFPFKLPFQAFSAPGAVSSSPNMPAPLSPTAIVDDPLASFVPATHTSPKPRHSPTASRTMRTHDMTKSPSTDSVTSTHSAAASSYHSPVTMQRDFSSSSGGSYQFSPRVSPLPAEHLPSNRILAKLDSILGPEALDSDEPTALDQPPRKLLLHTPVLQVVNANTVKDRHLFLFTDLLVIAKPLILDHPLTGQPVPPTLDNHFIVKSIVELQQLKVAATVEEPPDDPSSSSGKKRHPLLVAFVDRFANDPTRAIAALVQKGGLANDGPTIANLLFRNSDLNRNQLGAYLANPNHRHVLRAYIERFRFGGVRIDDALRLFLMSVRLPYDQKAAEYVLGVLATVWTETNGATGFDPSLTFSLILAILRLSDALHGGSNDAGDPAFFPSSRPTSLPSVDDFIGRFREHDTRMVVPEDLLSRIYTSIRRERIEQASDNSIFSMTPDIEASIEPAKLPTRLTYRIPSDVFTVSIPAPDPKFTIKLHGTDLQFDPPVLSFARSATQKFRVTGTALGIRVMVLIKRGANAPRYQGLPLNKAFSVERAFMQHTFQVSFTNHLDVKRKYMFSTMDPSIRTEWLRVARERIAAALSTPAPPSQALAAAQAVSVQVLRDVFLPPEEPAQVSSAAPSPRPNLAAPRFGPPVTPALPPPPPRTRLGTPTRAGAGALVRSHSVSRLYAAQFQHETDLSTDRRQSSAHAQQQQARAGAAADVARVLAAERKSAFAKTGHDLVLTTEQNSLLPLVLEFLNAGLEAAPHPVSLQGSAFQLPPLSPSSASSSSAPSFSFINAINAGNSSAL